MDVTPTALSKWACKCAQNANCFSVLKRKLTTSHIISAAVVRGGGFENSTRMHVGVVASPLLPTTLDFHPTAICIQSGFKILCGCVLPTVIQPFFLPSCVAAMTPAMSGGLPFVSAQQLSAVCMALGAQSCDDMALLWLPSSFGISPFQAYGCSNVHITQCPTAQADAGVNSAALCRTRTHGAIVRTVASGTSII